MGKQVNDELVLSYTRGANAVGRLRLAPRHLFLLGLAVCPLLLHDVGYMLRAPLWLDEAWVAIAAQARLADLPWLSSSSPVGFTFLIWAIPWPGPQGQRLLPLAFSVGTPLAAYLLVSRLGWRSKSESSIAGVLAGAYVLLLPTSLMRNDLKQYSADAFVTILVFACVALAEKTRQRYALALLAVTASVGSLLSNASALASVAAFLGLAAMGIFRKQWSWTKSVFLFGAIAAGGMAVTFLLFVFPKLSSDIIDLWEGAFLDPRSEPLVRVIWERLQQVSPEMGWPHASIVVLLLAAGAACVARLDRPATALTIGLLWVEMVVLGLLGRYPFLDSRTSHFLLAITGTFTAVALIASVGWITQRKGGVGLVLGVPIVVLFLMNVTPAIRSHTIPVEDVRAQVMYVEQNRAREDVVVSNLHGNWGFSHYWSGGTVTFHRSDRVATGFVTRVQGDGPILFAEDRTSSDVGAALDRALSISHRRNGRVWIVRSHMNADEAAAWSEAMEQAGVQPTVIEVGPEPVLLIEG